MAKTADGSVVQLPSSLARKAKTAVPGSDRKRGEDIVKPTVLLSETVQNLRVAGRTIAAIRKLARVDGTVSTAVFDMVQVANSGFSFKAYSNKTHQFDPQGTMGVRSISERMNTLFNYREGYADRVTLNAYVESALREVVLTGALGSELVLGKDRLPDRMQLVAPETLKFKSRGDGTKYPVQEARGGDDIELNIPTFWYASSHQGADIAYPVSMLEASLTTSFYYLEFVEDMRRAVRRSGHSRTVVTLNMERVQAAAPTEIRNDAAKMKTFMEAVRSDVESVVSSLEPEDALVIYDVAEVKVENAEKDKSDYTPLLNALSGILATSLKSHPSILGLRIAGSQSLSNTESLVYLKIAKAVQRPVADILSRAMTLSARLYGLDVYVRCEFNEINLRPDDELEAFKTMKQARILERLSLGFITDEEAAEELGTGPRSPTAPPLSGTMFETGSSKNRAAKASPNDDAQGRALQPDTPTKGGGDSQ